jgi:hypothetical protein
MAAPKWEAMALGFTSEIAASAISREDCCTLCVVRKGRKFGAIILYLKDSKRNRTNNTMIPDEVPEVCPPGPLVDPKMLKTWICAKSDESTISGCLPPPSCHVNIEQTSGDQNEF